MNRFSDHTDRLTFYEDFLKFVNLSTPFDYFCLYFFFFVINSFQNLIFFFFLKGVRKKFFSNRYYDRENVQSVTGKKVKENSFLWKICNLFSFSRTNDLGIFFCGKLFYNLNSKKKKNENNTNNLRVDFEMIFH